MNIEKRVSEKKKGRGRPSKMKNVTPLPSLIDFSSLTKLNDLEIDTRMLESMKSGIRQVDELFSFEGGIPCATNIMAIGDPGVGKTSMLLDILASIQKQDRKCLFISAEMGRKQMYKYTQRFKHFGTVTTLFTPYNTKDLIEQVLYSI